MSALYPSHKNITIFYEQEKKKKESKDKHVSETHLSSVRNDDIAGVGCGCVFLCLWISVNLSVNVRPCWCLSVCKSLSHRYECLSLCVHLSLSLCYCLGLLVSMSLYRPNCASINDGVIYSHFQLTTTIVFT